MEKYKIIEFSYLLLLERQNPRGRDSEIFYPLDHSQMAATAEAMSIWSWEPYLGLSGCGPFTAFSDHGRELDGNWSTQDMNWCQYGMPALARGPTDVGGPGLSSGSWIQLQQGYEQLQLNATI